MPITLQSTGVLMKPRFPVRWLSGLTSAAILLASGAAAAADVHVMISAGFYQVYSELAPAFERSTGHRLVTTRGPSLGDSPEAIPTRLKRGEPAGVVMRAGAPKPDISSVDAFRRTLLEAKSIAYSDSASGIYLSTTLFAKLGVADQVAGKSRKVRGPPSGEVVAAVVARGEAEIGFQQVSELIHFPGVTFVGAIPAELQQATFFSAALANAVRQPEAAETLIRFLASPEAAPAISKAGLAPLSGQ